MSSIMLEGIDYEVRTVEDNLRMVDDEMTLCMMRIDDIQRAINQGIVDIIMILSGYTE